MAGPVLGEVNRMRSLHGLFKEDPEQLLPLSDRPFDPLLGAEQLAHAKQRMRSMSTQIHFQGQEIQLLTDAIQKRQDLLGYIKEVLLHDVLTMITSDAKKAEYSHTIQTILDDERLAMLHNDMKQLLQRDHIEQKEKHIKELENRENQLRKVCSEKEKYIHQLEGEKGDLVVELSRHKSTLGQHLAVQSTLKSEIYELQRKVSDKSLLVENVQAESARQSNEIEQLKRGLAAAQQTITQLTDSLENHNANADQGKEAIQQAMLHILSSSVDVIRFQEQSVVASRLSTHWNMCRNQMAEGMERIRQSLRVDAITQIEGFEQAVNNVLKCTAVEMATVKNLATALAEERDSKANEEQTRGKAATGLLRNVKKLFGIVFPHNVVASSQAGGNAPTAGKAKPAELVEWTAEPVKFAQACEAVIEEVDQLPIESWKDSLHSVMSVLKKVAADCQTFEQKLRTTNASQSAPTSPGVAKSGPGAKALERAGLLGSGDGMDTLNDALQELKTVIQRNMVSSEDDAESLASADDLISQGFAEVKVAVAQCTSVPRELNTLLATSESLAQVAKTRATTLGRKLKHLQQKLDTQEKKSNEPSPFPAHGSSPTSTATPTAGDTDSKFTADRVEPLTLAGPTLSLMADSLVGTATHADSSFDHYIKYRTQFPDQLKALKTAFYSSCHDRKTGTAGAGGVKRTPSSGRGPPSTPTGKGSRFDDDAPEGLPSDATPLQQFVGKLFSALDKVAEDPQTIFNSLILDQAAANRVATDYAHCLDKEKPLSVRLQWVDSLRSKRNLPTLWPCPVFTPQEQPLKPAGPELQETGVQCELLASDSTLAVAGEGNKAEGDATDEEPTLKGGARVSAKKSLKGGKEPGTAGVTSPPKRDSAAPVSPAVIKARATARVDTKWKGTPQGASSVTPTTSPARTSRVISDASKSGGLTHTNSLTSLAADDVAVAFKSVATEVESFLLPPQPAFKTGVSVEVQTEAFELPTFSAFSSSVESQGGQHRHSVTGGKPQTTRHGSMSLFDRPAELEGSSPCKGAQTKLVLHGSVAVQTEFDDIVFNGNPDPALVMGTAPIGGRKPSIGVGSFDCNPLSPSFGSPVTPVTRGFIGRSEVGTSTEHLTLLCDDNDLYCLASNVELLKQRIVAEYLEHMFEQQEAKAVQTGEDRHSSQFTAFRGSLAASSIESAYNRRPSSAGGLPPRAAGGASTDPQLLAALPVGGNAITSGDVTGHDVMTSLPRVSKDLASEWKEQRGPGFMQSLMDRAKDRPPSAQSTRPRLSQPMLFTFDGLDAEAGRAPSQRPVSPSRTEANQQGAKGSPSQGTPGLKVASWDSIGRGGEPLLVSPTSAEHPNWRFDYSNSTATDYPTTSSSGTRVPDRPVSPLRGGLKQSQATPVTLQIPEQFVLPTGKPEPKPTGVRGLLAPRVRRREQVELMHQFIATHIDRHFGQQTKTPAQLLTESIQAVVADSQSPEGLNGDSEPVHALIPTFKAKAPAAPSTTSPGSEVASEVLAAQQRLTIREIAEKVTGDSSSITKSLRTMSPAPRPASAQLLTGATGNQTWNNVGTPKLLPRGSSAKSRSAAPATQTKRGAQRKSMDLSALGIVHVPKELEELLHLAT